MNYIDLIGNEAKHIWNAQMKEVRPISKDGTKVAVFDGDEGPKWNSLEFPTLPSFTAIPEGFGTEEAGKAEERIQRSEALVRAVEEQKKPKPLRPHVFEEEEL